MKRRAPDFLVERAELLAVVSLTQRDDVRVRPPSSGPGLPRPYMLQAYVGPRAGRMFAVDARAALSADALMDDGGFLERRVLSSLEGLRRELPYPMLVMAFVVTEDIDEAYAGWVSEPRMVGGEPRLVHPEQPRLRPFGRDELDRVVAEVEAWYDARQFGAA